MKRIAQIGGVIAGLGAGVVAALWLLKDKITGPPPAPVRPAEAPQFRVAPPIPEPAPAPGAAAPAAGETATDDLTEVNGIGPVYSARLAGIGITTFAGLAGATAEQVAEQIDAPAAQVEDWIAQATDLGRR